MSDRQSNQPIAIPRPTLERLPRYLTYLKSKRAQGFTQTSSTVIAQELQLNAVQVRKDLAFVSSGGKPRTGHNVNELIERLEAFLCEPTAKYAVLVGAGRLGQALLSYDGFAEYGMSILAAFDNDPVLIGAQIHGKSVFSASRITSLTHRLGALIGIIAVPAAEAQSACDQLIEGGVRGILNFAPAHIDAHDKAVVYNEDLAAAMALLAGEITHVERVENNNCTNVENA